MLDIREDILKEVEKDFANKYKEFVNFKVDPLIDNYEIAPDQLIVKVFEFSPVFEDDIAINENGEMASAEFYRTIPIAKVLKSDSTKYPTGSFVKLSDSGASTITNPYYDEYIKAQKDAPMKGSAKTPEMAKFVNNFTQAYGKLMFVVNPLKLYNSSDDFMTLIISEGNVICKIKDPLAYVS